MVITPAFSMSIKPWSRLVNAFPGELHHKVQVELQGIPLHAWNATTTSDLLRPWCLLESIDPDTLAQTDLTTLKVTARTTRPEFIPKHRTLVVPEPVGHEAHFS